MHQYTKYQTCCICVHLILSVVFTKKDERYQECGMNALSVSNKAENREICQDE